MSNVAQSLPVGAFLMALIASRLFVAAMRSTGSNLYSLAERMETMARDPLGSFQRLASDDLALWAELLRHQSGRAERWRLATWLFLGLAVLLVVFNRELASALGGATVALDVPFAGRVGGILIAGLWATQLAGTRGRPISRLWLGACVIGTVGGILLLVLG